MELKRRKSKVSYTVMIISDSAKKQIKEFHVKAGAVGTVTALLFLVVVFLICYVVYSSITLSDSLERSKNQVAQITQMKEENEELELTKEELLQKVSILSETVNQKVESEQAAAEQEAEAHLPTGFPLSGSAQIKTEEAEGNAEQDDDTAITLTADADKKEVIFTASEGIQVIASGAGTVMAVDTSNVYGNTVMIDHGNGYVTTYRNSGTAVVKNGEELARGAILFVIGEENIETAYSVKQEDTYIDPMEMIEING